MLTSSIHFVQELNSWIIRINQKLELFLSEVTGIVLCLKNKLSTHLSQSHSDHHGNLWPSRHSKSGPSKSIKIYEWIQINRTLLSWSSSPPWGPEFWRFNNTLTSTIAAVNITAMWLTSDSFGNYWGWVLDQWLSLFLRVEQNISVTKSTN